MGTIVNILIGAVTTTLILKTMATLDQVKELLNAQSQTIDEISSDLEELKAKVENAGMNAEEEAELVSLIEGANVKLKGVADAYTSQPETLPVVQPEEPATTPEVVTQPNGDFPSSENPTNPDQL